MTDDLAERLARLEGVEAARSLVIRYAAAVDAQDLNEIKDMFEPDATLCLPGAEYRGSADIIAFFERVFARDRRRNERKHHFVANLVADGEPTGTIAVTASYLYRIEANGSVTSPIAGAGRYVDEVRLEAARTARFHKKTICE